MADFGLKHNTGGAQRTNSYVIEEARRRDDKVIEFNHDSHPTLLDESYDIVVSNNLEHLSQRREVFDFLLNHPYHVRYEHDSNAYLSQQMRKDLFGSAKYIVFLSTYHHEMFIELYGDIFDNANVVSPPIDIDKFINKNRDRLQATLYVGFMHVLKGTNNFFNYVLDHPHESFAMAAWGDPRLERMARRFPNIEWLGQITYDQMPMLYNQYATFYYHPEKFEPFCRSVAEAIFCGMKMNVGDNIGAVKDFDNYGSAIMQDRCRKAPAHFWDVVRGAFG
jgi:glycosyltransferase involved in cell wall biosynthesis